MISAMTIALTAPPALSMLMQAAIVRDASEKQARISQYRVVKCVAGKRRLTVEKILAARPGSDAERRASRLDITGCVDVDSSTGTITYTLGDKYVSRGAIAETLLLADFSAPGVPRRNRVADVFPPVTQEEFQSASQEEKDRLALLGVAECVMAAQPDKTFAVFQTEVASDGEAQAIRDLAADFGPCVPEGMKFELRYGPARAFLAEAAYRESVGKKQEAAR